MQAQIAHTAGWHEQPRLTAKDFRGSRLQPVDRRIFQIDVVAYFSLRHGPAHSRRWLGYGVAAEIDNLVTHT